MHFLSHDHGLEFELAFSRKSRDNMRLYVLMSNEFEMVQR